MKTITITEARADFDAVLAAGKAGAVEIVQDGERIGVYIPDADAELIEDLLLVQKAAIARAEGYVGSEASKAFLDRYRNAQD